MSESRPTCPFPGFRPFEEGDTRFFFGRKQPTYDIIDRLARSSFVAVVGASGSGKSSLVRCGVLPALHRGLLGAAGHRWRIARSRPRDDPIGQLAAGLADAGIWPASGDYERDMIEAVLRHGPLGLVDLVEQSSLGPGENLLVFVDQFEELFRHAERLRLTERSRDDIAFVQLLLEAAARTRRDLEARDRTSRPRIFILITMRSDFLGDCSPYRGLPAWINDGFFLTPLLDREQRREIIEAPLAMVDATATPRLVSRLLNDAGDDPSMLPALQHGLMRTWEAWRDRMERGDRDPAALDLRDYDTERGLQGALDTHLDDILREIAEERPHREVIAERVFRQLTEALPDGRLVRRAATFEELATVCISTDAEREDLRAVLEAFRREGRTFLVPRDGRIEPDTLFDISHESLIWSWSTLRDEWMPREAELAAVYRPLSDAAEDRKRRLDRGEKAGPYRNPALAEAASWWKRFTSPAQAEAWTAPYDRRARRPHGFRDALDFLSWSQREQVLRHARWGLLALTLLIVGGGFWRAERAQSRREATRQQIELARGRYQIDPFLAARTLAELAGEDDPDGRGSRLALRILTEEPLPLVALPGLGEVLTAAFDAAGRRLLVIHDPTGDVEDRRATVYGVESGEVVQSFSDAAILAGWFERDSVTLIASQPLFSAPGGWRSVSIPTPQAPSRRESYRAVARSPGGSFLAATYGNEAGAHACVWEMGPEVRELQACEAGPGRIVLPRVRRLFFPSDSILVLRGPPETTRGSVLDSARIAVASLGGEEPRVDAVAVATGELPEDTGGLDVMVEAAFDPDRRVLAAGLESGALQMWALDRRDSLDRTVTCLDSLHARPLALGFDPDGRLLSVTRAGAVERRAVRPAAFSDSLSPYPSPCASTTPGALGTPRALARAGGDGALAGARIDPDGTLHVFPQHGGASRSWRPERLDPTARGSGPGPFSVRGHPAPVVLARWNEPAQRVATIDAAGELRIWDTGGNRWYATLDTVADSVTALAVSADGSTVAYATGDEPARVHLLPGGDPPVGPAASRRPAEVTVRHPAGEPIPLGYVEQIALDPTGRSLAFASGPTVYVTGTSGDATSLDTLRHGDDVSLLAVLGGGERLLSADYSGGVRITWVGPHTAGRSPRTGDGGAYWVGTSAAGVVATTTDDTGPVEFWRGDDRLGSVADESLAIDGLALGPGGRRLLVKSTDDENLPNLLLFGVREGKDWGAGPVERVEIPKSIWETEDRQYGSLERFDFLSDDLILAQLDSDLLVAEILAEFGGADAAGSVRVVPIHRFENIRSWATAAESGEVVTLDGAGNLRRWPLSWDALVERLGDWTSSSEDGSGR
ncbi:MAG: hypothetical protein R3266_02180 [Gemmatimonadota bacterium]|nr:hypothetical protein [Gemmatimonadota bacterium]